jgi:hypothetical protein
MRYHFSMRRWGCQICEHRMIGREVGRLHYIRHVLPGWLGGLPYELPGEHW